MQLILFILLLIAGFSFYKTHWHVNKPVEVFLVSPINNQTTVQGCLLQNALGDLVIRVNDVTCEKDEEGEVLAIPKNNVLYFKVKAKPRS